MDSEFCAAINTTADTSFDATAPVIARRPSGSSKTGFYRPGERDVCLLDLEGHPLPIEEDFSAKYNGPPPGRIPTKAEKDCAWQLQEEYLNDRLGKNDEENSRNWNTVTWIDRHFRITRMPAQALPPLNIYIGDKISQSTKETGAPIGPDDEAPDEVKNEGYEFESINIGKVDSKRGVCVMDENGTTRRLDVITGDYELLRLIDALEEIDKLAKIDIYKVAPPILPQNHFPSDEERAESGKIIRTLIVGMRTLWSPVIRAIADHATMTSLGQGKGVAATVGRTRVIEGLRLAESIRKAIARGDRPFSMWAQETRARQTQVPSVDWSRSNQFRLPSVDDVIAATLTILPDKLLITGDDRNFTVRHAAKLPDNDNCTHTSPAAMAA